MIRSILTVTFGVAAAATLTIAPAEAASYVVTLKTSATQADVAKTFTLSGKVTGKSAGKKTVTIQRRIGTAAWTKLTTVTTTSKGSFSKKLTVKSTGAKQYRVLAAKNGKTGAGTSAPVTVTGYTWLDLYDESYFTTGAVQRGWYRQLNGKTPPKHTIALSGDSYIGWRTSNLCDQLRATLELPDDGTPDQTVVAYAAASTTLTLTGGAPVTAPAALTDANVLAFGRSNGSGYIALKAPRAHCSVSELPVAYD